MLLCARGIAGGGGGAIMLNVNQMDKGKLVLPPPEKSQLHHCGVHNSQPI